MKLRFFSANRGAEFPPNRSRFRRCVEWRRICTVIIGYMITAPSEEYVFCHDSGSSGESVGV